MKVLVLAVLCGLARSLQYSDLVDMNVSCGARDSCRQGGKGPRLGDDGDWKARNCMCDDLCAQYEDCCLDAPSYTPVTPLQDFECREMKQFGGVYMRSTCMAGWGDQEVAQRCTAPPALAAGSLQSPTDPLEAMPATSLTTAVTYANHYCAVCNNDTAQLVLWRPRLECPTLPSSLQLTPTFVAQRLGRTEAGDWGFYYAGEGEEEFHACLLDPAMPETVGHMVRPCKVSTRTCAAHWNDSQVAEHCKAYTAVVYYYGQAYRNIHCALCNLVPATEISCAFHALTRLHFTNEFNPLAFSLLFDFQDASGSNTVGSSCGLGQVFDPFFSKCRDVICGHADHQYRAGRCVAPDSVVTNTTGDDSSLPPTTTTSSIDENEDEASDEVVTTTMEGDVTEVPTATTPTGASSTSDVSSSSTSGPEAGESTTASSLACERVLLPAEEYTMMANGTVVVDKYRRTYHPHEYETRDGGILVCIIQPESGKFSAVMGWLSLAGLGVSCLCLLLHLLAVLMVPDLRNLSGKNLASLCVALLAAYTTFILGIFGEAGRRECQVLAAAMYFFFLASFCWMNVMAFDIYRTLRMATAELRVSAGRQRVKFFCYSLYGWLAPAVGLGVVLALDLIRPPGLSSQYYPALGEQLCWFGQRKALLVFFAAPMMAILAINLALFVLAARIIAETTQSTAKMSCSPHHSQFKLYMRLALLMGLSWITGIVAGYLQLEALWYVFVLFNTLQGLFIFLAFTCTRKVWHVTSCWRRFMLTRRGPPWVCRTASSSRQGLESRDSQESHISNTQLTQARAQGPV